MAELIIKDVSLYQVDRDNDRVIHKNISVKDAQDYIKDLTEKIQKIKR